MGNLERAVRVNNACLPINIGPYLHSPNWQGDESRLVLPEQRMALHFSFGDKGITAAELHDFRIDGLPILSFGISADTAGRSVNLEYIESQGITRTPHITMMSYDGSTWVQKTQRRAEIALWRAQFRSILGHVALPYSYPTSVDIDKAHELFTEGINSGNFTHLIRGVESLRSHYPFYQAT